MYGVATLLFLMGHFFFKAKEIGPVMAGFLLIIISILSMVSGVEIQTGESINNSVANITTVTKIYSPVPDLAKIPISGLSLASGLFLFYMGYYTRKKRTDDEI